MKKMSLWLAMLAIIVSIFATQNVRANVQYMETLSIGSSTTPAVGSTTVLANLAANSNKYFRAVIQYLGVADMRYTLATSNPDVNTGIAVPNYGIVTIDSLGDMQNFKACAGSSTAASYGTATLHYFQQQEYIGNSIYHNSAPFGTDVPLRYK